jgi:hypothetical protein
MKTILSLFAAVIIFLIHAPAYSVDDVEKLKQALRKVKFDLYNMTVNQTHDVHFHRGVVNSYTPIPSYNFAPHNFSRYDIETLLPLMVANDLDAAQVKDLFMRQAQVIDQGLFSRYWFDTQEMQYAFENNVKGVAETLSFREEFNRTNKTQVSFEEIFLAYKKVWDAIYVKSDAIYKMFPQGVIYEVNHAYVPIEAQPFRSTRRGYTVQFSVFQRLAREVLEKPDVDLVVLLDRFADAAKMQLAEVYKSNVLRWDQSNSYEVMRDTLIAAIDQASGATCGTLTEKKK